MFHCMFCVSHNTYIFFIRTTALGVSFGMAFLILSLILLICFIGHFLVSKSIYKHHSFRANKINSVLNQDMPLPLWNISA